MHVVWAPGKIMVFSFQAVACPVWSATEIAQKNIEFPLSVLLLNVCGSSLAVHLAPHWHWLYNRRMEAPTLKELPKWVVVRGSPWAPKSKWGREGCRGMTDP